MIAPIDGSLPGKASRDDCVKLEAAAETFGSAEMSAKMNVHAIKTDRVSKEKLRLIGPCI